jgi:hypothetical protein
MPHHEPSDFGSKGTPTVSVRAIRGSLFLPMKHSPQAIASFVTAAGYLLVTSLIAGQPPHSGAEPVIRPLSQLGTLPSPEAAMEAAPYQVSPTGDGHHHAANPTQAMEARFSAMGLQLASAGRNERWKSSLHLTRWGYGETLEPVADAEVASAGNRIEYRRGKQLTEWYLNSPRGLEQGFTVHAPPAPPASLDPPCLSLVMEVAGDLLPSQVTMDAIVFSDESGARRLRYDGLKCWDALGRVLTSRMRVEGSQIVLAVDDRAAAYPVTIDPLFTTETEIAAEDAEADRAFGQAIAISGDTVIVGAHRDDEVDVDAGAAYVFVRSGGSWVQQQKLLASDAAANDQFGGAVAISGDTAIVGAYLGNAAYVFLREGGVWTEQQKFSGSAVFGFSVALQGDTAAVGAYVGEAVRVFTRSGTTWSEQQVITSSDQPPGQRFGYSVALDGDTLMVGAPDDNDVASRAGAVYVYVTDGTTWTEQQKLTASDGSLDAELGQVIALRGNDAVIGAPLPAPDFEGAAYFFTRDGTVWTEQQKLTHPEPFVGDVFGRRVALDGDTLLVCCHLDDDAGQDSGSVFVYTRTDGVWSEEQKLVATDGEADDAFGFAVALDLPIAAVTSLRGDEGVADSGSLYLYELDVDTVPPVIETVTPSQAVITSISHTLVPISVVVAATDDSGGAVTSRIVSITSNEAVDGPGSGNTSPDWEITGALTADIRAERSGTGNGRIYTIIVESLDQAGNPSQALTTVTVPKGSK